MTGGCLCGEIRYVLKAEPLTLYACHCTDCQRRTGTAFAMCLVVKRDSLEVTKGTPAMFAVKMDDGRTKTGQVCTKCNTRLWGDPIKAPGISIVQPGTLDDPSWLRPVAHIWTRSAQPWFQFPKDATLFEGQPEPGALARLWRERPR